jgi:hypothetical protein
LTFFHRTLACAVVAATLLTGALGLAERFDPLPQGLTATYFPNTTWTPPAALSILESQPTADHISSAWHGRPPDQFSAVWVGAVVTLYEETYTFATVSTDGSWVIVDGRPVVDNGGRHAPTMATGSVHLSRGAHTLEIRYFQASGGTHLEFLWARDGSGFEPVPAWALRSRTSQRSGRLLTSALVSLSLAGMEWLWVGLLVVGAAAVIGSLLARVRVLVAQVCEWRGLRWILAGSLVLNLVGVWWGLPGRWVPIEMAPEYVLDGLSRRFSQGWFDVYPPFHYYVLSVAISPMLLLQYLGRLSLYNTVSYTLVVVIFRVVGVAAGLGTVVATCLAGTLAFGRRAGLFAAAIMALTTPFVYYSKTANVDGPYLFWYALSLVFYLRLINGAAQRDYVLFAASATLAVCTKDQAYGLYLLAPLLIVYQIWQVNRHIALRHAFGRALGDRRLIVAAMTAVVIFAMCHNLIFNFRGFLDHVRYITGPGSKGYRVFEPTAGGHIALFRLSAHLIKESLGWPLLLVCLAGVAVAALTPRNRLILVWLGAPVVSYYFGFIDVVLYNYDRFVLPICVVLALFGGLAIERFLGPGARRSWRTVAVAVVLAYTLLYVSTVDALMVTDSRYAVRRWLRAHTGPNDVIGTTGLPQYLPRLDDLRTADIGTLEDLARQHPRYVVLNADYARAVAPDTSWGQLIGGLQQRTLGYRPIMRFRSERPWPWRWLPAAPADLVGPRRETIVSSVLRDINPTIEVFQCEEATCGPPRNR